MTNNNNGTYSFKYKVDSIGSISVRVYLLDPGKAYQEFYNGTDLTSSPMYSMTADYLSFNDYSNGFYGKDKDYLSVVLASCIKFPNNGPIQLRYT